MRIPFLSTQDLMEHHKGFSHSTEIFRGKRSTESTQKRANLNGCVIILAARNARTDREYVVEVYYIFL